MLKDIALSIISPLNQAILIVAIALCIHLFLPAWKKTVKACLALAGTWLFLCSQYFFSYWMMAPLENVQTPQKLEQMQAQQGSGIFVLACYYYDAPDKPMVSNWNECSIKRLVQAQLMYQHKPQTIILTGGAFNPYSDAIYANAAKDFLIRLGVAESDIVAIPTSASTKEQIKALADADLGLTHFYVVSSASHSYRIKALMEYFKVKNYSLFPVAHFNIKDIDIKLALPDLHNLQRSEAAFYEYAAIVNMWMQLD